MIQLLYRGFDGLDVSFAVQITHEFSEVLAATKERAQQIRQDAHLEWCGVNMLVGETGAKGGYAFRVTTGEFGATWFFKKPNSRDPWGVRVSCNSFNLATNGLGKARSDIYRTLKLLGVEIPPGAESIGRVDYALDYFAPGLLIDPDSFVMHSSCVRRDHIERTELSASGKSGRVTSVTVGKMPGRQVIVYDKRAEVIVKRKVGWWVIWNAARTAACLPPLNSENATESRVWRVELRAGKKHLKEDWGIRTWSDLDGRFGDLIAATLSAVRHTEPSADSNRARWPDSKLWKVVHDGIGSDLFEMRSWADPDLVKRVQLEAHNELLAQQMTGLLTTRAALCGVDAIHLSQFAAASGIEMAKQIKMSPSRYERKLAEAAQRYGLGTSLN